MCQGHPSPDHAGDALLEHTAEPGVYIRSPRFQAAVTALQKGFFGMLGERGSAHRQSSGFLPRTDLIRSEYLAKFPQFVARVVPELEWGESGLVTLPSACLSLYPLISREGAVPASGKLATIAAPCFRNEAHYAPERMRAFNMAEFVFFGAPGQTETFRTQVREAVLSWTAELGVVGRLANASDPFFGRMGEILAERQLAASLKSEFLVTVGEGREVAAFSINDHGDFFCSRWDIRGEQGEVLQSSCVGVGLERLALAMFHKHGDALESWPDALRKLL